MSTPAGMMRHRAGYVQVEKEGIRAHGSQQRRQQAKARFHQKEGVLELNGCLWARRLHRCLGEVMATTALHIGAEAAILFLRHAPYTVKEIHPPRPETATSVAHPMVSPRRTTPHKQQLQQKAHKQQTYDEPQREKQKGHKVKTSPD